MLLKFILIKHLIEIDKTQPLLYSNLNALFVGIRIHLRFV